MGAITVCGKGSRDRVRDRKAFKENLSRVKRNGWKSSAVLIKQKAGLTRYRYG
jgi:hypothetical protein